ncbi:hypothetical protein BC332_04817 [Capsicum chinense]|nr:hypothetical protein BC332_04817 [Capsicum chinense]
MTTESQMMDATTSMGANNIVISSRTNAPLTMAPAEKPEKFSGIDFKRWQQKIFFYLTTLCLQRFTSEDAPEWMDSVATCHVCANRELFSSFAPAQVEEMIYMANSATAKVEGTGKICLKMTSGKKEALNSDANLIIGSNEAKSTSGYVFTIGGGSVSWKSSKQTCIAYSTMESEFTALDKANEEAEWLRNFLEDISYWPNPVAPVCIHCDSQATIGRAGSMMYDGKSCHIRQRHNTVRELLFNVIIAVDYVKSKDNVSDPITKGLSREGVERTSKEMGLRPRTSQHGVDDDGEGDGESGGGGENDDGNDGGGDGDGRGGDR